MRRRTFLGVISAGAAGFLTGDLSRLLAAIPEARDSTFQLGGNLLVNRLGFGAMRLTGEGIWGWPPDRENAKKVLRPCGRAGRQFHRHGGVPSDVGCASKAKECAESSTFVS